MNSSSSRPTRLILPSPAKLNLFLHVVGRRADGYHELETLFQFLNFCDTLTFELIDTPDIELVCSGYNLPSQDNLIMHAAKLLQPYRLDRSIGVRIHLEKRIPLGGGLGGGSSNAATCLLALNALWKLKLSSQQLIDLGAQLGADIPIFLFGHAAFAQGIGEKLQPQLPKELWYLVLCPDVQVQTAAIFQHSKLPRNTEKIIQFQENWLDYHNDCENLVKTLYPQVAHALHWLLEYAPARLTGTGACVFAGFESHQEAKQVYQALPQGLIGFVAQGLNSSPTHQAITQILEL